MLVKGLSFESDLLASHIAQIERDSPIAHFRLASLERLTGGIWPSRYYVFGGMPGVAKSTLLNQVATDLAADGSTVLFFTSEIPASRLVEKSLVRLSAGAFSLGDAPSLLSSGKNEAVNEAVARYADAAKNLSFIEGPVRCDEIRMIVDRCSQLRGEPPIIFIDYLQLIASESARDYQDDRLAISATVQALRRIANDFGAPIFAISSINRANYGKSTADLSAFGGSSAIDYSFDSVFLMSVDGTKPSEAAANMTLPERPITIRTLKNRYGSMGVERLALDTAHATFRERE